MHPIARRVISLALVAVAGAAGCDEDPAAPDGRLQGGVLATFRVSGETFHVWATNPEAVQSLLALEAGESRANIPNGRLMEGPGEADHNAPWSWHLDPEDVRMAEVTIEACDGRPSMVEQDRSYWIDTVGRFCPWGAELLELDDLR